MDIDELLKAGWRDHGDMPQAVADQLAASGKLVTAPDQAIPFARLVVHVYGEHLGQWQQGVDLLCDMSQQFPADDPSSEAQAALRQGVASLRYASGLDAATALQRLTPAQRVSALATAAAALTARDDTARAIAAFQSALDTADAGLPPGSPAIRALAVAANNLAATLEDKPNRLLAETEAMLVCAEAALKYWKLAGTWLEEERAEYRLARSLLQAGQADAAVEPAQRCVDLCTRNGAPAFELFFAYAVLGLAQRAASQADAFHRSHAAALVQWQQVPEEDRAWCQKDLAALGSLTTV